MTELIGQTLGQYRIDAVLGSGGMGEVFRGTHVFLDRPAAIKVMQAHMAANPSFRSRFLQEAKAAAALRHPNIVEIYEFGEQGGQLYLVMELMTDGSLRSLLQQSAGQRWPVVLGVDLVRQAANGLAAAHAMNMVHRDIKPDNLLLNRATGEISSSSGQQYVLKISDFGLARLLAEGEGLTAATAAPMGTLAYMSPEQCQGIKVDGRSDIYSLGVVLYEVTTGLRPFKIESFVDALNKHSNVAPPLPRQMRPDLPRDLEEIILRCLAKRPEDRYATAGELANVQRQVLSQVGGQTYIVPPRPTSAATPMPPRSTSGTYIQPPETGGGIAPKVVTLPGLSETPRVHILDNNGNTIKVIEVRQQGMTIGRQSGNDIVLNEQGISRRHLFIGWDGQQVSVRDLGSSNGTYLENVRLVPQVDQVWQDRQMIRLGSLFWLRLEGADQVTLTARGALPTAFNTDATELRIPGMPSIDNSNRIGLSLSAQSLSLTPGQPAMLRATLTNLGSTVDWFTPTIEGVPPDWVKGTGQEVQLKPGVQENVDITINVPRSPGSYAQDYAVGIRVRSRDRRHESNVVQTVWTVQPYYEGTLQLEPRRVTGRGSATFTLAMQNNGNARDRYNLKGEDDEQKLDYRFGVNPVDLEPGREARIGIRVGTRRRWMGREQRYPFQIQSRTAARNTPATAAGEFVNKAVLPAWLLPVVGVVVAAGLVVSSFTGLLPIFGHPSPTPTTPIVVGKTPPTNPSPSVTLGASPTAIPSPSPSPNPSPTLLPSPTPTFSPGNVADVTPGSTIAGAIGSQYVASQDKLYFVEYGGNLSVLNNASSGSPTYQVLGTGYTNPEDVVVASDGNTAYITERSGDLVRVSLSNPNRSSATVIATGLTIPHQIVLDEANKVAYVAQFASPGLVRIDLGTGNVMPVLSTLQMAIGLAMPSDFSKAYITEQLSNGLGQLERFDLSNGNETVLATSSQAPLFMLSWTNSDKIALLVTERDPANKVWYADVSQFPATLQTVATVSPRPSSVVTVSSTPSSNLLPMLVCTNNEVDELK
jgi:serine/threonine protein kinase